MQLECSMLVMRRNKRPKSATRFWTRRFFKDGIQHENILLRELNIQEGLGINNQDDEE
jgi:hypothetical protein